MDNSFRLGSLRIEKGLSQQEMAKLLNVNLKTYNCYETIRDIISLEKLNILSNYFDVSLDYLLGNTLNKVNSNTKDKINYQRLTLYLKFLRKRRHITQKELAKVLNVSDHTISRYEANAYNINALFLAQLAKYFNISIDFLVGKTTKKEIP